MDKSGLSEAGWREALAPLSFTVYAEFNGESEQLVRELQRTRAKVVRVWPMPRQLSPDADVLLCDYAADLAGRLPWHPGEPQSSLILLLPQNEKYDVSVVYKCSPGAVLYRPFQSHAVFTALVLARSQFQYEKRLRARIERLDENLRFVREIERAKQLLMEQESLSEEEAYRRLRAVSMDRRISLARLAAQIVDRPIGLR
jgi:AmiR/NasT family two-component response regulator